MPVALAERKAAWDRWYATNKHYYNERRGARKRVKRAEYRLKFVAFDGEGSNGLYQLLACSATEEVLTARDGLSTLDCLRYFARLRMSDAIGRRDAVIGFGLSYDFENILRDVSDDDMRKLQSGKEIAYHGYWLRYVPHKFLDVRWKHEQRGYHLRLQDIYPYFQTSFINACKLYGIELPDIVYQGKRNRSAFSFDDIENITAYNHAELDAMIQLATALYDDFRTAFEALDLNVSLNKMSFYGPGAQAASVLSTLGFQDEFRTFANELLVPMLDALEPRIRRLSPTRATAVVGSVVYDPFVYAYFGGRIEAAVQGVLDQPLYDYDLISAYPYALTLLPPLTESELIRIEGYDEANRIGIYHVAWEEAHGREPFHPFPYRNQVGNVWFPPMGAGWVLSPEIANVANDAVYRKRYSLYIKEAYVFTGTEGYGDAKRLGNSRTSSFVHELGLTRARMKAAGNPANRALKLVANSLYGKTLQKTGSHRYFNAFVAAWITSVTRARLWEAIRGRKPGEVISTMTDGILSTVPLDVQLGSAFGDWEEARYAGGVQYVPGVYTLTREDGTELQRFRGYSRFDTTGAYNALVNRKPFHTLNRIFVGRALALHVEALREQMYHFVDVPRDDTFTLASKRMMEWGYKLRGKQARYYPPKQHVSPLWVPGEPDTLYAWEAFPYVGVVENVAEALDRGHPVEGQ